MLAKRDKPALTLEQLQFQVSNGARAMVRFAFEDASESQFDELKQEFLDTYLACINQRALLYPGIDSLLSYLEENNIAWGVVTNKPALYTDHVVEHFGWKDRAAVIICPDHVKHTKPNPEPLFLACDLLETTADKCVYVGDHIRDIQAAQAADMHSIGCEYGYLNENENAVDWAANHLVSNPLEVIGYLKQLQHF
jgi:phosphoglycolate phosphatase